MLRLDVEEDIELLFALVPPEKMIELKRGLDIRSPTEGRAYVHRVQQALNRAVEAMAVEAKVFSLLPPIRPAQAQSEPEEG